VSRPAADGGGGAAADKPDTAGVPFPPPLAYVAGLLAGAGLELAFPVDWPPTAVAVAGAVAGVALWLAFDGSAMLTFRRAGTSMVPFKPSDALVTSGPYRHTRNPMYVGMVFLYLGLALAFGLVWAMALLPLVLVAVDRFVIAREEAYLERRFGEPYRAYRKQVRRWL